MRGLAAVLLLSSAVLSADDHTVLVDEDVDFSSKLVVKLHEDAKKLIAKYPRLAK